MIKILFICHGNICRSPMAEFVLKDMVEKRGIANHFYIESAATSTEEIYHGVGNPVYPPVRSLLEAHQIDCRQKHARQITESDYDNFDYLIGMDDNNIRNMKRVWDDSEHKIYKMMSFAGTERDVADPWYTRDFQQTWDDVEKACIGLLEFLLDKD